MSTLQPDISLDFGTYLYSMKYSLIVRYFVWAVNPTDRVVDWRHETQNIRLYESQQNFDIIFDIAVLTSQCRHSSRNFQKRLSASVLWSPWNWTEALAVPTQLHWRVFCVGGVGTPIGQTVSCVAVKSVTATFEGFDTNELVVRSSVLISHVQCFAV